MRYLLILLFAIVPNIVLGGLTECIEATCRISVQGASGTGCVFEKTDSRLHILTAAHVVGNHQTVKCEFWKNGVPQNGIFGTVLIADVHEDVAVVAMVLENTGLEAIRPISLAPKNRVLTTGEAISSVGCANGGWGTSWVGHVTGARDREILFRPPPAGGRSGSAVFDSGGTEIIGMITARNNRSGEGIAVSLLTIHDVVERVKYCTPNSPPGNCVPLLGRSPNYTSPPDMTETNRKLDAIAELLKQINNGTSVTPLEPETEEQKRLSLLQAASMIGELRNDTGEKIADGSFGVTAAQILCGALGISGPIGIAIGAAGWLVSRRLGRRLRGSETNDDETASENRIVQSVVSKVRELLEKKEG